MDKVNVERAFQRLEMGRNIEEENRAGELLSAVVALLPEREKKPIIDDFFGEMVCVLGVQSTVRYHQLLDTLVRISKGNREDIEIKMNEELIQVQNMAVELYKSKMGGHNGKTQNTNK